MIGFSIVVILCYRHNIGIWQGLITSTLVNERTLKNLMSKKLFEPNFALHSLLDHYGI